MVLSAPRATDALAALGSALAAELAGRAAVSVRHDLIVIDVPAEHLVGIATLVRDDPRTRCDLYSTNAGVDTGTELRSVTFVRGTATRVSVMLRTPCSQADPHVPTLCEVWVGANWPERETYDMFGIQFDGHPDLRRIFLEESFPGHPLRKAFLPPRSDARGG